VLNLFTRSDAIGLFKQFFERPSHFRDERCALRAIIVCHLALSKSYFITAAVTYVEESIDRLIAGIVVEAVRQWTQKEPQAVIRQLERVSLFLG
jgi:hypothetical protein